MSHDLISPEKFWKRFSLILKQNHSTIVEVCAKSGVSYSSMRSLKSRNTYPDILALHLISKTLGMTVNDLIYDYESPKSFL